MEASLGFLKSRFAKAGQFSGVEIAQVGEIPNRGVKLFAYPTPQDSGDPFFTASLAGFSVLKRRIMVRTGEDEYVAYSQKCTHLSCAVYFSAKNDRLECPCHQGFFSIKDGSVLQGPPARPLPQIILERDGSKLFATGVKGT